MITVAPPVIAHSAAHAQNGEELAMTAPRHILIVDGDATSRAELAREMARLGYTVGHAASAEAAALALARHRHADLVLIETDLPDGDGRELVARLRRRGVMLPMLLLSATASEDAVVAGLDAGADDYLVRPLRPRELVARIRAQLRVAVGLEETDLRVGLLTYRPSTRTAFQPFLPQPVRLTEKEAALLARLCHAEGRPVSRETLLREVWGYSPNVSSHTVETHVYRLRRKIEGGSGTPPVVLNDEGGYRLATIDSPAAEAPRRSAVAEVWAAPVLHAPVLALAGAVR
jgi:DNA-binding response OmpR family regulator